MSVVFSPKPEACDICHNSIQHTFVDGKTIMGPWAIMCPSCRIKYSVGLGTGLGQKYEKQGNQYVKVEG